MSFDESSKKVINVAFALNDVYIPFFCSSILSIANTSASTIHSYVLYSNLSDKNIKCVTNWIKDIKNLEVKFINVRKLVSDYDFFTLGENGQSYITEETYYRLILHRILPSIDKIIYLDADTIARSDIQKLYDIDLENNILGAVPDIADNWKYYTDKEFKEYREKVIGVKEANLYFNAGVLLLNLKKIREHFPKNSLIEYVKKRDWKKHDQDILNFSVHNNWIVLDYRWNLIQMNEDKLSYFQSQNEKIKYLAAKNSTSIIHYAAKKPWKQNISFFDDDFWEYTVKTPYAREIIENLTSFILSDVQLLKREFVKAIDKGAIGIKFSFFAFIKAVLQKIKGR